MDSLSMTPPLSPVGFNIEDLNPSPPRVQEIENDEKFTCFNCLGEASQRTQEFHPDSYWMSKYLSRVCRRGVGGLHTHSPTVELFSYNWQTGNTFTEQLDKLFLLLRQNIGEIQSHTNMNMMYGETTGQDLMARRLSIVECLDFVSRYISRNDHSSERLEDVMGKLHTTLLYIGRLTDLPSHVTLTTACHHGNKTNSGSYQSFHLHLDVYWRVLVILYTIEQKYPDFRYTKRVVESGDQDLDVSLFDQVIQLVLWDLVALACQRYLHKVSNGDFTKVCMFSCMCVKEMWLLVLKILEARSHKHGGQSFWISLHQVLTVLLHKKEEQNGTEMEIDSDLFLNPPEMPDCKDVVGLSMWIISSVAPLYNVKSGDVEIDTRLQSNYHDVETLLKTLLAKPSLTEAKLRLHLKTCLQLSSLWEPSTGILVILWEYYYKRLNNTFQLSSTGIEGLASIKQGVSGLYSQCKKFVSEQPGTEQETSFQLFLRLLALHLGRHFTEGSLQEWKQMKGRFYSKFHQRRIQNLSEGGLYNLTSLFLTIAMVTDVEDVGSKLCDFYNMLDIVRISFSKRSVVWCGAFTLMLIYTEKQMDVGFLADKMTSALDNAVSEFASDKMDNHHSLWKLILLYLEGVQEVFDASQDLQLSQYKLINGGLKQLLPACSDSELRTTLAILHGVINRINEILDKRDDNKRRDVSMQQKDVADAIWNNIYPFVKEHSMTLTPPPQLADLAAVTCLLALKSCSGDHFYSKESFLSVFQHFALGDATHVSISCRFLGHLLSSKEVGEKLAKDLPNHQTAIVKAWFRCVLHIPASSQLLAEVTRCVIQLEEVRSIFSMAEIEISGNLDIVPVQFLKAIERAHRKMQTWKDRMEYRDRILTYFSDVTKQVAMVIKNHGPPEAFNNVYKMSGYLVKYCAPLLFIESKPDCPLPSIINSLIVPYQVLNPEKPLQPTFLSAVRDTLHLFIQGLSRLDYKKSPYVQRRLKDIVTVYLQKFPLKSSSVMSVATSVHPIVASLSNSYTQHVGEDAVKFRQHLLQLVIDNFIVVKNMAVHPSHAVGISFIHEVVQRTTNTEILAKDAPLMLPWLQEYLLLLPDTSPSLGPVSRILQATSEACALHSQVTPLTELSPACSNFIKKYFKFSWEGTIKVMEKLGVLNCDLVITVIKTLSACVLELEAKRGVGVDKRLRHKYYALLKTLGDAGEQEIIILQSDQHT